MINIPKVYCIIVTYNGMKWIEKCLSTIKEEQIDLHILLIDNNSSDETVEFVQSKFPDVRVIPQSQNLGFGGANNLGYEIAKKENADYIYLLNQDTISYPNTISKLITIFNQDAKIGVVSPIHLNDDGSKLDRKFEDYISARSCPDYISDLTLGKLKDSYTIGFVNAAAWLIKVETVKTLGGLFSSAFYHYGEDSNFLSRLKYHGKKCVIAPNSFIHHLREERKGKMSSAFEKKQLSIKKVEIMTNINFSYHSAINILYRFAGQQFFKGNFSGAFELFLYPIFSLNKIKKIRSSYLTNHII